MISFGENLLKGTSKSSKSLAKSAFTKSAGLFFGLGIFLILQMLLLSQGDLEEPLIPIHLALMGYVGACSFSAIGTRVSVFEVLALIIFSGLLSLGSMYLWILIPGWILLVLWGPCLAFRGGRK